MGRQRHTEFKELSLNSILVEISCRYEELEKENQKLREALVKMNNESQKTLIKDASINQRFKAQYNYYESVVKVLNTKIDKYTEQLKSVTQENSGACIRLKAEKRALQAVKGTLRNLLEDSRVKMGIPKDVALSDTPFPISEVSINGHVLHFVKVNNSCKTYKKFSIDDTYNWIKVPIKYLVYHTEDGTYEIDLTNVQAYEYVSQAIKKFDDRSDDNS